MIREAVAADAEAIVALRARAWRHAYSDFLGERIEDGIGEREANVAKWRARLVSEGECRTFVWDQDDQVAGFVSFGPGELRRIYVDPPAQGAGVGGALIDFAEERIRALGSSVAELSVFSDAPARVYYEARGWRPVPGSEEIDPPLGVLHLLYRKAL